MSAEVRVLAEVIWTASRADESTISAIGADHVARAVLAAGYVSPAPSHTPPQSEEAETSEVEALGFLDSNSILVAAYRLADDYAVKTRDVDLAAADARFCEAVEAVFLAAGYISPADLAQHDAEVRREHGEQIARAIEDQSIRCPIHTIPDCSPLLNGCSWPTSLHNQANRDAAIARAEQTTRAPAEDAGGWW